MNYKTAIEAIKLRPADMPEKISAAIAKLNELRNAKMAANDPDLAWLDGADKDSYVHDMKIAQRWASLNRKKIGERICAAMGWSPVDVFETIHNYLGDDDIVRKSAISAKKGEKVLIPLNMRDGSVIAVGKGNEDWNCSAPHGAGRAMSRAKARAELSLKEFGETMSGIFTTSVCEDTLDEAPDAYKPSEKILSQIKDTVDVTEVIKPIYNFKAAEKSRKRGK